MGRFQSTCLGCFSCAGGRPSASGVRPEGLPCHGLKGAFLRMQHLSHSQTCSSPKAWIYLDVLVYLDISCISKSYPHKKTWIYLVNPGYTWLIQRNLGIAGNQKQRFAESSPPLPSPCAFLAGSSQVPSVPRSSGLIWSPGSSRKFIIYPLVN